MDMFPAQQTDETNESYRIWNPPTHVKGKERNIHGLDVLAKVASISHGHNYIFEYSSVHL
jgi:hypothetical protein